MRSFLIFKNLRFQYFNAWLFYSSERVKSQLKLFCLGQKNHLKPFLEVSFSPNHGGRHLFHCLILNFSLPELLVGNYGPDVRPLLTQNMAHLKYKILNNVHYLNKISFKFGKVKSPLSSFCKSVEETIIHLFSEECLCARFI